MLTLFNTHKSLNIPKPQPLVKSTSGICSYTIFTNHPITNKCGVACGGGETPIKTTEEAINFLKEFLEKLQSYEAQGFIAKIRLNFNYDGENDTVEHKIQVQKLLKRFEGCSPLQKIYKLGRMTFL